MYPELQTQIIHWTFTDNTDIFSKSSLNQRDCDGYRLLLRQQAFNGLNYLLYAQILTSLQEKMAHWATIPFHVLRIDGLLHDVVSRSRDYDLRWLEFNYKSNKRLSRFRHPPNMLNIAIQAVEK